MISMLRAEWHCDLSAKAHALRVCLHAKPPRRIALSHPATTAPVSTFFVYRQGQAVRKAVLQGSVTVLHDIVGARRGPHKQARSVCHLLPRPALDALPVLLCMVMHCRAWSADSFIAT